LSKVKFELNRKGVAELLKGAEMQGVLSEYAEQVHQRCAAGSAGPDEYEASTQVRGTRAVATVRAATKRAYHSNLKHNTLLKALRGARK